MGVDTIRLTENMAFFNVFLLAFNYTIDLKNPDLIGIFIMFYGILYKIAGNLGYIQNKKI